MPEEDKERPVEEILREMATQDADFLSQDANEKRQGILRALAKAYTSCLTGNLTEAEPELNYLVAEWQDYVDENPDSPELFTNEEMKNVKKWTYAVESRIYPGQAEMDSMLAFLDENED